MKQLQKEIAGMAVIENASDEDPIRGVEIAVRKRIESFETFDNLTVGYDFDRDLHDYGQAREAGWWGDVPPIEGTRFRIFHPEREELPERVEEIMDAIGATYVGRFHEDHSMPGSYDYEGRVADHYVLPDDAPFVLAVGSKVADRPARA